MKISSQSIHRFCNCTKRILPKTLVYSIQNGTFITSEVKEYSPFQASTKRKRRESSIQKLSKPCLEGERKTLNTLLQKEKKQSSNKLYLPPHSTSAKNELDKVTNCSQTIKRAPRGFLVEDN